MDEVAIGEGGRGVTYEATGIENESQLLLVLLGDSVTEIEASVTVAERGYVASLDYDLTVEKDGRTRRKLESLSMREVGTTAPAEPAWMEQARTDGIRFDASLTADGSAIELTMVNGTDVPRGTRLSLSTGQHYGELRLEEPVSTGDRLLLSFSPVGEFSVSRDGVPDDAPTIEGFASVTLRDDPFTLFGQMLQL